MKKLNCFVISPIGSEGTDIREHANDVFDYIIKPACEAANIIAMRADHDSRPGMITDQMYGCILADDLIIGVLTFHNPNVFYEVAIAEAAARPLILMIEEGASIPFDIKDRRILVYDLKPRNLMTKVHVEKLSNSIRELKLGLESKEQRVSFDPSLSPLGTNKDESRVLRRTNDLDPRRRVQLIDEAEEFLKFRGLAFFQVPEKDEFISALRRARSRGVKIQTLLMNPGNMALSHQLRDFSSNYETSIKGEIESGVEMWTDILGDDGQLLLQEQGMMTGLLQMNEKQALITKYSISVPTADSPCIHASSTDPHYESELKEFDFIWSNFSKPSQNAD